MRAVRCCAFRAALMLCCLCAVLGRRSRISAEPDCMPPHKCVRASRRAAGAHSLAETSLPRARSLGGPAFTEDVDTRDFLGACAYRVEDLEHEGHAPDWHVASSACSVLSKYDRLLVMGDSLTRQARSLPRQLTDS